MAFAASTVCLLVLLATPAQAARLEYSPGTLQGGHLSAALPAALAVDWEKLAKK